MHKKNARSRLRGWERDGNTRASQRSTKICQTSQQTKRNTCTTLRHPKSKQINH